MVCPFISFVPFPIFPPYRHWYPSRDGDLPVNIFVRQRLEEIDSALEPLLSYRYCNAYLSQMVHRLTPASLDANYVKIVKSLESMLTWSFANQVSLLDWNENDARNFLDFYTDPPSVWTSTAVHSRFAEVDHTGKTSFSTLPFNNRWRCFCRRYDDNGKVISLGRRSLSQNKSHARGFFDFYRLAISDPKPNPLEHVRTVRMSLPPAQIRSPTLSSYQLNWMFEFAMNCSVPTARSRQVGLLLAFARDTPFSLKTIVGSPINPACLSQFRRANAGTWEYLVSGGDEISDWYSLSPTVSAFFEGHLENVGIDPVETSLGRPLFPQTDPGLGYAADSINEHLVRFRKLLVAAAEIHPDNRIASVAPLFRRLSFQMVRRSNEGRCPKDWARESPLNPQTT
jgi:hypothetical protein